MSARSPTAVLSALLLTLSVPLVQAQAPEEHAGHQQGAARTEPAPGETAPGVEEKSSQVEHVPPEPPQQAMEAMPYRSMAEMMQMDDRARFGRVLIDQLEWRAGQGSDAGRWEGQAWYGGDYHKLRLKAEGERTENTTEESRVELLWDRILSRWWSVQTGIREDFGEGPSRTWVAMGIQGLAPYWFDIEATGYISDRGRAAIRFKAEYDLLFTQRLILQPALETNLYGKSDPQRGVGSGFSDFDLGLRLRYEIRREFAPYVGVTWIRRFGLAADLARAAGDDASDLRAVAGFRVWF